MCGGSTRVIFRSAPADAAVFGFVSMCSAAVPWQLSQWLSRAQVAPASDAHFESNRSSGLDLVRKHRERKADTLSFACSSLGAVASEASCLLGSCWKHRYFHDLPCRRWPVVLFMSPPACDRIRSGSACVRRSEPGAIDCVSLAGSLACPALASITASVLQRRLPCWAQPGPRGHVDRVAWARAA